MIPDLAPILVAGCEDRVELAPAEIAEDGVVVPNLLCWSPDEVLVVEQDLQQALLHLEKPVEESDRERRLLVLVRLYQPVVWHCEFVGRESADDFPADGAGHVHLLSDRLAAGAV